MAFSRKTFLLVIFLITSLAAGCDKDDVTPIEQDPKVQAICAAEGGTPITGLVGRVYRWTNSEPIFYYIGNPNQLPSGENPSGMIPCSGLPKEFQQEGLLVVYSGIDKGSLPDTGDPLFGFVILTNIEKAPK